MKFTLFRFEKNSDLTLEDFRAQESTIFIKRPIIKYLQISSGQQKVQHLHKIIKEHYLRTIVFTQNEIQEITGKKFYIPNKLLNACKKLKSLIFRILSTQTYLTKLVSIQKRQFLKLKQLINLDTKFSSCIQNPQIMASILSQFNVSRKIQTLKIDFDQCINSIDRDIADFCDKLKSFKEIQDLRLKFSWNVRISTFYLASIAEVISKLSCLKHFCLNIIGCRRSTDQGISQVFHALAIKNLESLTFNFIEVSCLNDLSISSMNKMLKALTQLKIFRIKLPGSQRFTIQNFINLLESTFELKSLIELELDCGKVSCMTSNVVNYLTENLEKLLLLEKLLIRFPEARILDDDLLGGFFSKFAQLTELRQLFIYTERCHNIGDIGLIKLSEAISKLQKLEKLICNFGYANDITYEGVFALKKAAAMILSLKKAVIEPLFSQESSYSQPQLQILF